MAERICPICILPFLPNCYRPDQRYCSLECYRNRPLANLVSKSCEWCTKNFAGKKSVMDKHRFCSNDCQNAWQSRFKDSYTCKICHKDFKWSPSRKNSNNIKYCSISCRDVDPEVRQRLLEMNIAQSKLKITKLETMCYQIMGDAGIKHTPQYLFNGKFAVDAILMDVPIVVQFDGDYWHGCPKTFPNPDKRQQKRMSFDRSQDAYMKVCGYEVVRVWASEMKDNPDILITRIRQAQDRLHSTSL